MYYTLYRLYAINHIGLMNGPMNNVKIFLANIMALNKFLYIVYVNIDDNTRLCCNIIDFDGFFLNRLTGIRHYHWLETTMEKKEK